MGKYQDIKINNSRSHAIMKGKWKNPGAKLYDALLDACHYEGGVPDTGVGLKKMIKEGKVTGTMDYLKEAYLVVGDHIENSPHGRTPFSRSGCKYPHHVIRNGELVVSVPGLRSAYICARNQGVLTEHTSENRAIVAHFNKHFRELGIEPVWHHGQLYFNDKITKKITENFEFIESVISNETGIFMTESTVSDFIHEIGETPDELYRWMNANMKYDKVSSKEWKLKSPEETYSVKKGNCHDQSLFECAVLDEMGFRNGQLFFVEFSKDSDAGGNTHTITWFRASKEDRNVPGDAYYWLEHAWEDQRGIYGPFDGIEMIKQEIFRVYDKDTDLNSHKFDGIVFGESNEYRIGMSLGEYVESWNINDDRLFSTELSEVEWLESQLAWIERFVHDEQFRESVSASTTAELCKQCDTPEDLLKWMKCIKYGWKDKKGKINGTGDNDETSHLYEEYRLQSPNQLIKSKIGLCWDQVELERVWFEHHHYPYAVIYVEADDGENNPTHSFIIYKEPGQVYDVYWFESSWGEQAAIHKYDDLKSCLRDSVDKIVASFKCKPNKIIVRKLTEPMKTGTTCEEYYKTARNSEVVDMGDLAYDEIFNESLDHHEIFTEETEDAPPPMEPKEEKKPENTEEEQKKESRPKQIDKAESSKNGVRRKKLYVAFIEWCKEYNDKNTFGSIFDKDAFHTSYPFVPHEMRYFYRLANPMLCVLSGDLTFFPVAELRKVNSKNSRLTDMMIFAATPNDLRVFKNLDKKVYRAVEENGAVVLKEVLGDTFDMYIQNMIKKGDILNAPLEGETGEEGGSG